MVEAIEDGNETAGDGTTRLLYTDRLSSPANLFFCPGSAAGAAALKSGQGPPGRGIAVRRFSPLRRREGPPPQPQTTRSGQKLPRFTVFCALPIFCHFSDLMAEDGPTWANIGLKMGQDGAT